MYSSLFPRNDNDPGYIVAWKFKRKFETGQLDGEMTYGEARKKAEELSDKEPDKTYWAQKKLEFTAH